MQITDIELSPWHLHRKEDARTDGDACTIQVSAKAPDHRRGDWTVRGRHRKDSDHRPAFQSQMLELDGFADDTAKLGSRAVHHLANSPYIGFDQHKAALGEFYREDLH